MTVAARSSTNGHSRRRPVQITLPRAALVERLIDLQVLAESAIDANGASLQVVMRLPPGAWRDELQMAHHQAHAALKALLIEARLAAGRYDGVTPRTEA